MHLFRAEFANQIDSSRDVAPLIAAAHLEATTVTIEELQEVVSLQHQIAELGEGDPILTFARAAYRLFLEHVIHGEMLPSVAQKRQQIDGPKPIGVIDDARLVGLAAEIK